MKLATTDSDRRPLALVSHLRAACMKWVLRPVTSGDPQGSNGRSEAAARSVLALRGWCKRAWEAWCRVTGAEVEARSGHGLTSIAASDLSWLLNELNTLRAQRDDLHEALNRYALDGMPRLMGALARWADAAKVNSDAEFLASKVLVEAAELIDALEQNHPEQEIDKETADVLITALRLCAVRGKDPIALIRMKMPLNVQKYGGVWEG